MEQTSPTQISLLNKSRDVMPIVFYVATDKSIGLIKIVKHLLGNL